MIQKRRIGALISLLVLVALFLHSGAGLPERRPNTTLILDRYEEFDGEKVVMDGVVVGWEEDGVLLERFGRTFCVRSDELSEGLIEGSKVRAEGYFRSEGLCLEATRVKERSEERDTRLWLLSLVGLAVLVAVLYGDRDEVMELVPFG